MQAGALVRVIKVQIIHELSSSPLLPNYSQFLRGLQVARKCGSKLIKFESSFVWPLLRPLAIRLPTGLPHHRGSQPTFFLVFFIFDIFIVTFIGILFLIFDLFLPQDFLTTAEGELCVAAGEYLQVGRGANNHQTVRNPSNLIAGMKYSARQKPRGKVFPN